MKSLAILLFVAFVQSIPIPVQNVQPLPLKPVVNHDMVAYINSIPNLGWKASVNQGSTVTNLNKEEAKMLCGVKLDGKGPKLPRITHKDKNLTLPESFDSRTNWPDCTTMRQIRDQSACGSCWAFGAVEAMSDRYCVTLGMKNLSISAQDMNSCCDSCGDGCGGGYPSAAWGYWQDSGVVSSACDPYSLPGCDHHIPDSKHPCPQNEYNTPSCVEKCQDSETWNGAKHFGKNVNSAGGEDDIMAEIYQNGPVETAFEVYEDFLSYKSGVYKHTTGDLLGGHAVKFLGWGVESGTKYWIVANSWNPDWGDNGYFKIVKGVDECGIEDEIDFGTPAS